MARLEVLNPVAAIARREASAAPRPDGLDGQTIGLFWNNKAGGNTALRAAAEFLGKQYPALKFREYQGSAGSSTRYMTPGDLKQISAECDLVIGSTADCGSCTSWLINDMVQLEKAGIPTVSFTARHFQRDAKMTADIVGLRNVPLAIVDGPFTNRTVPEIRTMVASTVDYIETSFVKQLVSSPVSSSPTADVDTFEADDLLDAVARFNDDFVRRGVSDGLPLVPPTVRSVERMLSVAPLSPDTIIADALYPGLGVATLEKIAINGVMAGCRPEHLPVLVASVRAYVGTGAMGKTQAMSTGPNAPLIMVSGPIVKQLGFNNSTCALGPGSPSHVNTVIGRALRLILMNIGQAYPGRMDMDTIGTPNKYSFCVAENAERSPWRPWNVEKGFPEGTSTLSIALVYPGPDLHDMTATSPESFLDTLVSLTAHYRGTASVGRWLYGGRVEPETAKKILETNVLLLAPDHARLMKEHTWTRADIGEYLYRASRMPFKELGSHQFRDKAEVLAKAHPELMWLLQEPNVAIPTAEDPRCYESFVVGGDVGRSQYLFGGSEVPTIPIDEWSTIPAGEG